MASKEVSVLSARMAMRLNSLSLRKEVLDQVAGFVELHVDFQRHQALGALRDADQGPALVHVFDDPIAVERLVGEQGVELQTLDQRGHADRVVAISRHQHKPHEIAQGVGQGQDFGRPAALRLAYSLTESPPFEPCP